MGGTLFPPLADPMAAHVLHRWVAAVVGAIVVAIAVVAWRTQRDAPDDRASGSRRRGHPVPGPGRGRRSAGPDAASPSGRRRSISRSERSSGRCSPGSPSRATTRPVRRSRPALARAPACADSPRRAIESGAPAPHAGRLDPRLHRARRSPGSSSCCSSRPFPRWSSRRAIARHRAGIDWFGWFGLSGRWSAARSRPAPRTRSTATSTAISTC